MRRALTLLILCLVAVPLVAVPAPPALAASTLTATIPSGEVAAGGRLPAITGTVTGPARRRVWVQARASRGWVTLAEGTSRADGAFTLPVPTWWVARQELRVYAPAASGYSAVAASETGTVTVTRRYTPRPGTAHGFLGARSRWDACHVVTYRVNRDRMPQGAFADVKEALRRVSEATGIRFRYAGGSSFVPYRQGSHATLRGADLVVAWAPPRMVPGLAGDVVGLGGYASIAGGDSWHRIVQGFVVLDSTARLPAGFGGNRSSRGLLLLHELGHATGLDHVADDRQVMYPLLEPATGQYAGGDLRGLAAVGAERGCFDSPTRARAVSRGVSPLVHVSAP